MSDYTLYYWPCPFRGQFVRAALAHVEAAGGATWDEADAGDVVALMDEEPADQPVPHMGPPLLVDHAAGISLAQTAAILAYLGARHDGLMPKDAGRAALTLKTVEDANDVLYEMTRFNGARMWTKAAWKDYRPRLARWMEIFEETGRRHGLTPDKGYFLGTRAPRLADLTACVLWGTMTAKLPQLRPLLDETAPAVAGLVDRIAARPEQAALRARSGAAYGDDWCGGQIEASLRAVL